MNVRDNWLKVWHGPFTINPLNSPVAVGDVLAKILEVAWKASIVVIIVYFLVAVIALVVSH